MAEWLGRGLQNLIQRFESAWDLQRGLENQIAAILFSVIFLIPLFILFQFILILF